MKKGSCGVKPVKLHRIRAITMKKKRLTMENKREIVGFVFISPWIIGFLMFFVAYYQLLAVFFSACHIGRRPLKQTVGGSYVLRQCLYQR